MKEVTGNLLSLARDGEFDVIVHGCNCFNHMGAGLAVQVKKRFPEVFLVDCETQEGDRAKLGTYTSAKPGEFVVVNAYTQFHWRDSTELDAVRAVFRNIKRDFGGNGYRFGVPKIGAGLGRGEWDDIVAIITAEMTDEDLTVVKYGAGVNTRTAPTDQKKRAPCATPAKPRKERPGAAGVPHTRLNLRVRKTKAE